MGPEMRSAAGMAFRTPPSPAQIPAPAALQGTYLLAPASPALPLSSQGRFGGSLHPKHLSLPFQGEARLCFVLMKLFKTSRKMAALKGTGWDFPGFSTEDTSRTAGPAADPPFL